MTYAAEIETFAGDEEIVACVIGEFGWNGYPDEPTGTAKPIVNEVLTWEQARPMLDYEYDNGYGAAPECHAIYVWTADQVIYSWQYDGATRLSKLPRNPLDCEPDMAGG